MLRHVLATAALLLVVAPARAQQDDPFETHLYNVEFLTEQVPDHPGEGLGLGRDLIGTTVSAGSELSAGLLTGEDLANLIKSNVVEDSWEHVSAAITYSSGVLFVTNRKSVHEKIVQYINFWRGYVGRTIVLDAAVISIDPQLLAKIRSAGNADRPGMLPADHYKQVLEAAREGKLAEIAKAARVTAHPGQRVNLGEFTRQEYLRDYDVQIATASVALDPVIDVFSTGFSVDVRPFLEPFAGGVTVEVRADLADLEAIENRKLRVTKDLFAASPVETGGDKGPGALPKAPAAPVPVEVNLQLPKLTLDRLRTTLTIRNRETAIVGSVFRKNRNLLFLLTPAIVAADEKPSPEPVFDEQRLLRLFDISPLTRGIQDFAGPKLDVVSPSRGGGGPLTGATFTLDEPAVAMSPQEVVDIIKTRVAKDTWENSRNMISVQGGSLVIRQKPEVLKEVERFLATLLTARAQMITTEAVVVGFKKGARADWEKDVPALGLGGYYAEQAGFDKLLEEAYKGQKVRLVEMSEITSFPQERVHSLRSLQEAQLSDYEPQVSSYASMCDPIIGLFSTGFVLDVRAHFVHGNDQIGIDFRGQMCAGQMKDLEIGIPGIGPLQAAQARVLKWSSKVSCVKGKWSLVGLEMIGKGDDAEDWVLFVRARQNVLK
jgi:hypothetical protein